MSHSILMLITGFVAGCGVMAGVWALISGKKSKAAAADAAQREEILQYINGLLADTDALESGFRAGALSPENFKRQLGDKINAVMRALRTNMHLLDVFYVKFVEQQAHEYLRVLENPERRKTGLVNPTAPLTGESFDIGSEALSLKDAGAPPPLFVPDSKTKLSAIKADEIDDGFELPKEAPPVAPPEFEPEPEDFSAPAPEKISIPEPGKVPAPGPEPEEELILGGAGDIPIPQHHASKHDETPPEADTWEEFEAAFEQFEVQEPAILPPPPVPAAPAAPPPPVNDHAETGRFPVLQQSSPALTETGIFKISEVIDSVETPTMEIPMPILRPAAEEAHMTETSSIDRSAIAAALAVKQIPLSAPPPPQQISVPEPQLEDDDEPLFQAAAQPFVPPQPSAPVPQPAPAPKPAETPAFRIPAPAPQNISAPQPPAPKNIPAPPPPMPKPPQTLPPPPPAPPAQT
ncbi:MAG: hypothetical protein FWB94_09885, partial [Chitinispirillia bacterium]|nr:hypothetical protein [Chitinispirillia bacterium]